jgi:ABC-2 type transport system permease protein
MAVYERTYKRYTGPVTAPAGRFTILPRFVVRDVFQSKWLVFFYAFCFLIPLLSAVMIYVSNNLQMFENAPFLQEGLASFKVGTFGVLWFMSWQGGLALFLTVFTGPNLVSRDLANNGLALYLSRPISRAEYVLGKSSVLFGLISSITWVPGIFLFFFQSILDDSGWLTDNMRLAFTLVVGGAVWAIFLSLLALAISAWVKWRTLAAFSIFMVFPMSGMFSGLWAALFHNSWGALLSPIQQIGMIWSGLAGEDLPLGPTVPMAWFGILLLTSFFLLLLHLKIRAYEVIR